MEVTILDKMEADDSFQALKDFGAQWANYFRGVQQVLDNNKKDAGH